jgi:hypothetical protein
LLPLACEFSIQEKVESRIGFTEATQRCPAWAGCAAAHRAELARTRRAKPTGEARTNLEEAVRMVLEANREFSKEPRQIIS